VSKEAWNEAIVACWNARMMADGRMISEHGLFIWEVVKAHVATSPKYPETFHYRGDGLLVISSRSINLRRKSKPQML